MAINNDIFLSQYTPLSELIVEQHRIKTPRYPIFDAHTHFGPLPPWSGKVVQAVPINVKKVVESFKQCGVKAVVNLDGRWGKELDEVLIRTHPYEDFILTFGSLDIAELDTGGFEANVRKSLKESKEKGMKGLKFWRDISTELKDSSGKYIRIDDKRLKVIWETAAVLKLPVLIHIADPVAFFKPVDNTNERFEELHDHPGCMFAGPEYYSFGQLMEMQQNLLGDNPDTTFIIAHFGSYAENLAAVGAWLDKYPNMYIDVSARIAELGRQPYTSRKFFMHYKDRILFGTDTLAFQNDFRYYEHYYRFFETFDEYFDYSPERIPNQGRWKIYGIGLEDEILENIYFRNAERIILGK